ncbi:MAG TPA: hypothetical protein VHX15_07805 [Frankiaceae bacterium]|jgi:hypothetical protein|nr:hypothetical protein [Frankiaceae bacterium]
MTASPTGERARPGRPATVAGGLLAITLAAGCGSSSGGGSIASPSASASPSGSTSPSATDTSAAPASDNPFSTASAAPAAGGLRDFHDASTGVSLTMPVDYVVATTPAQAAARFPAVLGTGVGVATQVSDAQTRLKNNTIMIAFHPPIGGVSDNVGVIKLAGEAPTDPTQIQSSVFVGQVRSSLTNVGAKNIRFTDTKIGGEPAEQIDYSITPTGAGTVFGRQFYLAAGKDIFVVTITAGTAARAATAGDFIAASWKIT